MAGDWADRADFDTARRGLIARLEPGVVRAAVLAYAAAALPAVSEAARSR